MDVSVHTKRTKNDWYQTTFLDSKYKKDDFVVGRCPGRPLGGAQRSPDPAGLGSLPLPGEEAEGRINKSSSWMRYPNVT